MDMFTKQDLARLISTRDGMHVSIYSPTHRKGLEVKQDRIRFKNLLGEAHQSLVNKGMKERDAETFLRQAYQRITHDSFWQHQSDCLAVFITSEMYAEYRLPMKSYQFVSVGDRFYVKPLIPLAGDDIRFLLLAINQGEVRVFEGNRYGIDQVNIPDIPPNISEALSLDDPERQQQWHSETPPIVGGRRAAMFHGQGSGLDESNKRLARFYQKIDGGLRSYLQGRQDPLILAADDHLIPLYQEANTYPALMDRAITINPSSINESELHKRALAIVEPILERERESISARYAELSGSNTGGASKDLETILTAAHDGRVDSLFVANDMQQWGTFDAQQHAVSIHQDAQPGDQDLLDLAVVETLNTGGRVFAVETSRVPDSAPAAAVFRY
ncbi:MAG: hypothetical protein ACLFSB_07970 [Chitinispirillaceae bacterium]